MKGRKKEDDGEVKGMLSIPASFGGRPLISR